MYTDGSFYERSDGQLVFLHAAPPTVAELAALVADIKRRAVELLEKLGLGPDEDDDWDAQQLLLGMGELYPEGVFHKGAQCLRNGKPRTPSVVRMLFKPSQHDPEHVVRGRGRPDESRIAMGA